MGKVLHQVASDHATRAAASDTASGFPLAPWLLKSLTRAEQARNANASVAQTRAEAVVTATNLQPPTEQAQPPRSDFRVEPEPPVRHSPERETASLLSAQDRQRQEERKAAIKAAKKDQLAKLEARRRQAQGGGGEVDLTTHTDKTKDWLCGTKAKAEGMGLDALEALAHKYNISADPKTCALVSNSGVLLSHTHGADIDAADLVFRFNDAEVGGENTQFVGARDDIRILNGNFNYNMFWPKPPIQLNNHTVYVLQRIYADEETSLWASIDKNIKDRPWLRVLTGSKQVEDVAHDALVAAYGNVAKKLTTGFMGAFLALSICDEVRAYGFAETPNSPSAPFHYFGELKKGSASQNDVHVTASREKLFWRGVATNLDVDTTDVAVVPGYRRLQCDVPSDM